MALVPSCETPQSETKLMNGQRPVLVGGEALYDFISTNPGAGLGGTRAFEKRAGGSPFNIAVGIGRLGAPAAFLGKIGTDQFGDSLVEFLHRENIATSAIVRQAETKTTLAFVAVDSQGRVDFRFYRDNAADTSLTTDEVANVRPDRYSFFHLGGTQLIAEPTTSAYASVYHRFADAGLPVSLDPTIRESVITDREGYRQFLLTLCARVDVLKVSDEELKFLSKTSDPAAATAAMRLKPEALLIVTLGPDGAVLFRGGKQLVQVPGFRVKVVETTGCGDSFMAAVLAQLAGRDLQSLHQLTVAELSPIARFANAAAAIVATRYGAAEANPTRSEVEQFLLDKH